VHIVFDANRELNPNRLIKAFEYMGIQGFGRDASIGLGKFAITQHAQTPFPAPANANAVLTLAPCTPQGLGFDSAHSYYQLFTRFGRHGAQAAQAGRPFKTPVLLAKTGALFSAKQFTADTRFIGQGLGGNGQLSKQIPATVQQAYAPVIPLHFVPNQELP
jgi:CRISPR-associated protein Csm4